jgi:hypothetical protein
MIYRVRVLTLARNLTKLVKVYRVLHSSRNVEVIIN